MTTRRISRLSFVLEIVCIVFLLTSGSAKILYSEGGNCPDAISCNSLCAFLGYKDHGSGCTAEGRNLCCCIKHDGPCQGTP
ncbi:hypothetical protein JHK82_015155 [Glycine max]|nr:hypothetical protein JHK85_015533 [Glycine max]KAG5148274.1 hypothetical protein JHK82_015155 [Glycine max]